MLIIIFVLLLAGINVTAQIKNINSHEELSFVQKSMKTKSEQVVVWGYFINWGKYPKTHQQICPGGLDKNLFYKITTSVSLKLFSDSTTYYMPLREPALLHVNYKENDLVKLKIRLFKQCPKQEKNIFFLIEDIL